MERKRRVVSSSLLIAPLVITLISCVGISLPQHIIMAPQNSVLVGGESLKLSVSPAVGPLQWKLERSSTPTSSGAPKAITAGSAIPPNLGAVTTDGIYIAPTTVSQPVSVTVTASLGSTLTASTQIEVVPQAASIDFNNRQPNNFGIASGIFAAQRGEFGDRQGDAVKLLQTGGFTGLRVDAGVALVFNTPTPDWSSLDKRLGELQNTGVTVTLQLFGSPIWLQQSPTPCRAGVWPGSAPPTDNSAWAKIAAAFVHHVSTSFPGLVRDYEIWNEPDGPWFFCTVTNTVESHIPPYVALYAAAAKAMKAQAAQDGVHIRVGGPATSNSWAAIDFLTVMLQDSSTAPFVDFVSFHEYITGGLNPSYSWDGTVPSLLSVSQDPDKGIQISYVKLAQLVKAGSQSNAIGTPIYITEYQTGTSVQNDCCRNDPTFGPLWNALFVSDYLNAVYAGAQAVPSNFTYFAAVSNVGDCLLSFPGTNCAPGAPPLTPFPQYYAYELLAAENYLNLSAGGYMASSASSSQPSLITTGFQTPTGDALMIINTGSTDINSVGVVLQNVGFSQPVGTAYLLNKANPTISQMPLNLTAASDGYVGMVNIPAYSVVAVRIQGAR